MSKSKELYGFGKYMVSDERAARYKLLADAQRENGFDIQPTGERLKEVSDADVCHWKENLN